jgi:hypothetical protein
MEQVIAAEAGPSDSATYRDASIAKLEMFLEDTTWGGTRWSGKNE